MLSMILTRMTSTFWPVVVINGTCSSILAHTAHAHYNNGDTSHILLMHTTTMETQHYPYCSCALQQWRHNITHTAHAHYNQGSYTQLAIKFKGFQGFFKGFQVAIFKGNPVYNSLAFFTEPVKQRVNHSIPVKHSNKY